MGDKMPSFDVDWENFNVFEVEEMYLFKQYFDRDEVFKELRPYYNADFHRFEISQDDFDDVDELLDQHFYSTNVVSEPERFCVVYPEEGDVPDVLFIASVLQQRTGDHLLFLM